MHLADDVGLAQREQVVVALLVAAVVGEPLAAVVGLGQAVGLDHRPHGAVEHEDALAQCGGEVGGGVWAVLRGHVCVASGRQQVEGISMPGSSRRVRAMSDELPPAGALRLARVAGVPVYLDRTWLLLGAFVAWTGWQNARDLGTGGAARLRRLHGGRHPRRGARPRGRPRRRRPAARVPGAPHRRDALGRAHGLRRARAPPRAAPRSSPAPARWPTSRWPAVGGAMAGHPAVAGIPVRLAVHVPQPAARRVQPAARAAARRRPARAVAGLGGQRPPRPRARRRRLVRPGARRGGGALVRRQAAGRGRPPTCSASGSGWSWAGSSGRGRRRRCSAPRWSGCCCGCARRTSWTPVVVVPASTPVGELVGIGRRVRGARRARHAHPAAARAVARRRPTSPPCRRPRRWPPWSSSCPTSASSSSHPAPTRSRCCGRWPRTGSAVVVVTSAGTVRGLVTSERLNAVAETVLGRN